MNRFFALFLPVFAAAAGGCGSQAVTPGSPHTVARAAAAAYSAAGHKCEVKKELAYCDMTGADLPLVMGYDAKNQQLLFATVYDTQTELGLSCPAIPADRILRPSWMVVKCDQVELADKSKKVVLSVLGGGRIPDEGLSRAELNRSAGLFMQEAEGYLLRLKTALAQAQIERTRTRVLAPTGSTRL